MDLDAKVFVAGGRGLVGSAVVRKLTSIGATNIVAPTSMELDLTSQSAVNDFMAREKPAYVFLAAARVGGIMANDTYPADFVRINLLIQTNTIDAAHRNGVRKLLFFGTSCIYPKFCPQPMKEDYLLTGLLEPTNEGYAVAKISGIKMCQAYRRQFGFDAIAVMPTSLYGPGDNFHLENSHVVPALIRKFHDSKVTGAKEVLIWGTGQARREFMHVDDLADAAMLLMKNYSSSQIINIGVGDDISIGDLARTIRDVVECEAEIVFDPSKPEGTPRKLMDIGRQRTVGWAPAIGLADGLRQTYEWYLQHADTVREV